MLSITEFLLDVMASVVAHSACKWLDKLEQRKRKNVNPP